MDRHDFTNLYLHANGLANLAFLRAMAGVTTPAGPTLSADQLAAHGEAAERMLHLTEEQFDWSALAGVDGFGVPATQEQAEADATTPDATAVPADDALAGVPTFSEATEGDALDEGAPDIARYLAQVEAARAVLAPRVSDCYARADPSALGAALTALPHDPAPLTGPLTADAFGRWLARYEAGDASVQWLVNEVRKLEMGF